MDNSVSPLVDQENKGDPQAELILRIEKSKNLKIAFTVIGEMGHMTPIIRVMAALEANGHETVLLTSLYAKEKA